MAACLIAASLITQSRLRTIDDLESPPDLTTQSDDALVKSAKMGDTRAFATLMERYQRFCWFKAYSILRNQDDADDEVQSAWTKAWAHVGSYHAKGSFAPWLSRIVHNQCLMRLRKARFAPMVSVHETFDSEGSFRLEVIDQRALPEQVVGDDEVLHLLSREIRSVPFLLREVLVMRCLRQLPMQDVATELGISVAAAKSRLMRALIELKKRMEKHYGERGCGALMQKSSRPLAAYVRAS